MKKPLLSALLGLFSVVSVYSQTCPSAAGDQTTYGTNNTWIGYVYDNADLTNYYGFVNQGTTGNPDFDQSFGGDDTNYPTNGCPVFTSSFSVRYKLRKTFAAGSYDFTVGADDGYRLSVDGGATWLIDRWLDQGYNTFTNSATLSGTVDLVLEFYENAGGNRVSFSVVTGCGGSENPSQYGVNDVWRGYVYDGTSFNSYKGMVQEGSLGAISFDQSFGGNNTNYATSGCPVQTETFSVRYRLAKNFTFGSYTFIVGADDGFRLSFDGGTTWPINRWNDQSYTTQSYTSNFSGNYNMVLEFFENGGDNRIRFEMQSNIVLKINLLSFTGKKDGSKVLLNWDISADSDPSDFQVERSADGISYTSLQTVAGRDGRSQANKIAYSFTDNNPLPGKSFYRLRMTDQTGIVSYSSILLIQGGANGAAELTIFPTIVSNNTLYFRTGRALQQASIQINDISGRLIYRQDAGRLASGQTLSISPDKPRMSSGVYLVSISEKGKKLVTERVIVP